MARTPRIIAIGAAAVAAVGVMAAPAHAATAISGLAASGNVQASLLGVATVTTSIGTGSCQESVMKGKVNANGSGLSIASATFSGPGGASCSGSVSSTITAQNTPWNGGNVTFDAAHTGGRDATVTIANFRVKAVVNIFGGITCIFGGNLTANGFNPTNASRPDTTVAEAQVGVVNATVNKVNSGSSFLCPGTATVSANYKLQGETVDGSGVYNSTLSISG